MWVKQIRMFNRGDYGKFPLVLLLVGDGRIGLEVFRRIIILALK
jgi:hypothetical protein